MEEQNEKNNIGPLVGIIIVISMLMIGAFYFYNENMKRQEEIKKILEQEQVINEEDISTIEIDAEALNFDDLGAGIDQI